MTRSPLNPSLHTSPASQPPCHRRTACIGDVGWFNPWVGKIPWRRKWQPIPIFLPGNSHAQRSLVGCRLWGRTESVTTEVLQCSCLENPRDRGAWWAAIYWVAQSWTQLKRPLVARRGQLHGEGAGVCAPAAGDAILLSLRKECNCAICRDMDASRDCSMISTSVFRWCCHCGVRRPGSPRPCRAPGALPTFTSGSR